MRPQEPTDAISADDATVVVYVAVFAHRPDVRRSEHLLGRLWASGQVEVLDGELLDWPAESSGPLRRPLQSLPRLAALPDSFWTTYTALLHATSPHRGNRRLPLPAAPLAPNQSAVVAFCAAAEPDQVTANLQSAGATVTVAAIASVRYDQLRRGQV